MSDASLHSNLGSDFSAHFRERYRKGEWRDTIFRDMILHDVRNVGRPARILDIGCGRGFDGDVALQQSIASAASRFIGVEPDQSIEIPDHFSRVYRTTFEQAPIDADSIDISYALMVLEHLKDPQTFFDNVYRVLTNGGVFWALTVDSRHWFCRFSQMFDSLYIKEIYLRILLGRRGEQRYENYPVFYKSNNPREIERYTEEFSRVDCFNFSRIGQCNSYFPKALRPMITAIDSRAVRRNAPGSLLAVRLQK